MARLYDLYKNVIRARLMKEFNYKNKNATFTVAFFLILFFLKIFY